MSSVSPTCRAAIYERDRHTCQAVALLGEVCTGELTVHHLVPSEDGGGNEHSNLLTVCRGHHDTIHYMVARPRGVSSAEHARRASRHLAEMRRIGLLREGPGKEQARVAHSPLIPKVPPPTGSTTIATYRSKTLADVYKIRTPKSPVRSRRRRPEPEPMEWTDPGTGQTYVLTPRGARPVDDDEGVALAG